MIYRHKDNTRLCTLSELLIKLHVNFFYYKIYNIINILSVLISIIKKYKIDCYIDQSVIKINRKK